MQFSPPLESQLQQLVALEKNSSRNPWPAQHMIDCFVQDYTFEIFTLPTEPEQIVGYWILQSVVDELHLLNFTIAKSSQGNGYGYKCLLALIQRCHEKGLATIELEVRESNTVARNLYTKCGFFEVGYRKDYYDCSGGTREGAILMRYTISQ